jgi:hypothetical protein
MGGWAADDLEQIGRAEELQLASRCSDGTLSSYVSMWVVRHGDDV